MVAKIVRADVRIVAIHCDVGARAVRETFVIGTQVFIVAVAIVETSRGTFPERIAVVQMCLNSTFTYRDRVAISRIPGRYMADNYLVAARVCGGRRQPERNEQAQHQEMADKPHLRCYSAHDVSPLGSTVRIMTILHSDEAPYRHRDRMMPRSRSALGWANPL
jgi:hypothetical protein